MIRIVEKAGRERCGEAHAEMPVVEDVLQILVHAVDEGVRVVELAERLRIPLLAQRRKGRAETLGKDVVRCAGATAKSGGRVNALAAEAQQSAATKMRGKGPPGTGRCYERATLPISSDGRSRIDGKVDAPEHRGETGIAAQVAQQQIDLHVDESAVALDAGAL